MLVIGCREGERREEGGREIEGGKREGGRTEMVNVEK